MPALDFTEKHNFFQLNNKSHGVAYLDNEKPTAYIYFVSCSCFILKPSKEDSNFSQNSMIILEFYLDELVWFIAQIPHLPYPRVQLYFVLDLKKQGGLIDSIQHNVQETIMKVEESQHELKKAMVYKKKNILTCCCPAFIRNALPCVLM